MALLKPNILFIMTDQHRWDALGCTGNWVKTPNIDRLAKEGITFRNAVCNSPTCVSSRVSLATGKYPHNTHIWYNFDYTLPPPTFTWMQCIRDTGYRTSLFGSSYLHPQKGDLRDREYLLQIYGLDDINELANARANIKSQSHYTDFLNKEKLLKTYRDDLQERYTRKPHATHPSPLPHAALPDVYLTDQTLKYLESYEHTKPWFCWVNYSGPAAPWDAQKKYIDLYQDASIPKPLDFTSKNPERPKGYLDQLLSIRRVTPLSPEETQELRINYAGKISLIDEQIGRILNLLEELNELNNTVIVFTSDHGEMNGDYGLLYKSNFLNSALKIPLIIRTPEKNQSGLTCDSLVELIDIGPTLVEMVEGIIDYEQFGISLLPLLKDTNKTIRQEVLSEIMGEVMIMDHQSKLATNPAGKSYLYMDIENDPDESVNLAGSSDTVHIENSLRLRILQRLIQTQVSHPEK